MAKKFSAVIIIIFNLERHENAWWSTLSVPLLCSVGRLPDGKLHQLLWIRACTMIRHSLFMSTFTQSFHVVLPPPLHFASSASKTLQADTQSLSSLCSVCPSYFIHPWLTTSQEVPNNPLTLRTISFIWAAELRSINSADQCHNDCNFNVTSHVHLNIVFSALANLLMSVINRPWLTMARQTLWTQACRVSRWTLGRPLLMAKIGTRLLIY